MILTGLHVLTGYQSELRLFLRKVEGFDPRPYFDTATPRLATIGIGFNIEVSNNLGYVLEELGIDGLPSETEPTKTANQIFKSVIDGVPDGDRNFLLSRMDNALREHFPSLFGPTDT